MSSLTAVKETTFSDLGLHSDLVRVLNNQGITIPFPIQEATIPDAIAGCDILGRGQTGSGKTLAFGLALLVITTLGLPTVVFAEDDPWAGDVHTVVLDADNLTAFVSGTRLCMVEFYTPWVCVLNFTRRNSPKGLTFWV